MFCHDLTYDLFNRVHESGQRTCSDDFLRWVPPALDSDRPVSGLISSLFVPKIGPPLIPPMSLRWHSSICSFAKNMLSSVRPADCGAGTNVSRISAVFAEMTPGFSVATVSLGTPRIKISSRSLRGIAFQVVRSIGTTRCALLTHGVGRLRNLVQCNCHALRHTDRSRNQWEPQGILNLQCRPRASKRQTSHPRLTHHGSR